MVQPKFERGERPAIVLQSIRPGVGFTLLNNRLVLPANDIMGIKKLY